MISEPQSVHDMVARKRAADRRIAEAAKRVTEARKELARAEAKLAAQAGPRLPTHPVRRFIAMYAAEHGVTYEDIVGQAKPDYLVKIRHECIAAFAEFRPDYSTPRIGAAFGGRDHTTIIHALRRVHGPYYRRPRKP